MTRLSVTVVLLSGILLSRQADAREAGEAGILGGWYGWQLVLADAAAAALVLAPIDDDARGAAVGVGMTALFMNGSVVNMANGNPRRASLSLLRLPAFLTGRLMGFGTGHLLCKQTGCKGPMQTWGGAVALGAMVVFDWVSATRPQPYAWAAADSEPPAEPIEARVVNAPAPPRPTFWTLTFPVSSGRF